MSPDELCALRVEMAVLCGWRLSGCWLTCGRTSIWLEPGVTELDAPSLPDYPHDIAAAWQVMEAMRARGWEPRVWAVLLSGWMCRLSWPGPITEASPIGVQKEADTAPLAICLAARAALRGHNDGI